MVARPTPLLDRLDRVAGGRAARAVALCVGVLAVWLQAHTFFLAESHEVDSYSYWFAARAVARGHDPYDTAALQADARTYELRLVPGDERPPGLYPFVYPPPFAALWRVTLGLSPAGTHRLLEVLGALALGLAVWLLDRLIAAPRHRGLLFALFALGLAVNGPAVSSTRLGQMNAPLLVLMLAAALSARRGGDRRSAFALAAATLVKLSPAMLLAAWGLGRPGPRGFRYLGWFALALVMLVALSLPWAPPEQWRHFASALRTGIPWQTEYSWWGWLTLHGERSPGLLALRIPLYLAGAALLAVLAATYLSRLRPEERIVEGAAIGMVFVLLLSPLTWQHHFLFFMLPAWAWTARAWAEDRPLAALALAALALLVLLRLPGSLLLVRPVATLAALLVSTLALARGGDRVPAT